LIDDDATSRQWTALLLLVAPASGGATTFGDRAFHLRPGDVLLWPISDEEGYEDPQYDDAAGAVLEGEKIVANMWFGARRVRAA
jgi:hypothetical protein